MRAKDIQIGHDYAVYPGKRGYQARRVRILGKPSGGWVSGLEVGPDGERQGGPERRFVTRDVRMPWAEHLEEQARHREAVRIQREVREARDAAFQELRAELLPVMISAGFDDAKIRVGQGWRSHDPMFVKIEGEAEIRLLLAHLREVTS